MFTETVTGAYGDTTTGKVTEAEARYLLARSVRLGCTIEPTTAGGVRIVRTVYRPSGARREHTIELTPEHDLSRVLTERTRKALALIDAHPASYRVRPGDIHGSMFRIPPGESTRLLALGLVVRDRTHVWVSLAARLAVHASTHRTHTTHAPGGRIPCDAPRYGLGHDCPAVAACKCGWSEHARTFRAAQVVTLGHLHAAGAAFVSGADQ